MPIFGTKEVLIAELKPDGTIPLDADFKELCKTYRDSVEIVDADPEIAEEFSDQTDEPIAVFATAGKTDIKFSSYEYTKEVLHKILGGTIVDSEWTEGDLTGKEVAFRIFTDSGHRITYPKVKIFGKKNLKMKKKEVALLECVVKPMSKISIKKMP